MTQTLASLVFADVDAYADTEGKTDAVVVVVEQRVVEILALLRFSLNSAMEGHDWFHTTQLHFGILTETENKILYWSFLHFSH